MRHEILVLASLIFACARPPAGMDPFDNTVPRYGDPSYKTIWSKSAPAKRPMLRDASRDAANTGWGYLENGDLSTAMKRFNQAWTLCPENPAALWGMAKIQSLRTRTMAGKEASLERLECLDQAVELIEEAAALPSPIPPLLNSCADLLARRGDMRRTLGKDGWAADFDRAEERLRRAESMEAHPELYVTWAKLERYRGNSRLAELYASKAQRLQEDPAAQR